MDKISTRKYGDQSLGYWVINDPILTANLYEIAMQTFPLINKLDTTKFAMELCGNQAEYLLFFVDKANLGRFLGGEGYVVIFRREGLMPIDLQRTQ